MLRVDNVTLRYGSSLILADANFELDRGQVVALIGANGSGKSTLLTACAGLTHPWNGEITWLGSSVARMSVEDRARQIAFLPQRPSTYVDFTVRQLIELGRHSAGPDPARIEATMEELGIAQFAARPAHDLSMGERQRVLLARVLVQHDYPGLIILDEPFSAMDAGSGQLCINALRRLAAAGTLVMLAVHDVPLVDAAADHVIWLQGGEVRASGLTSGVLDPAALSAALGCRFDRVDGMLMVGYPAPRDAKVG